MRARGLVLFVPSPFTNCLVCANHNNLSDAIQIRTNACRNTGCGQQFEEKARNSLFASSSFSKKLIEGLLWALFMSFARVNTIYFYKTRCVHGVISCEQRIQRIQRQQRHQRLGDALDKSQISETFKTKHYYLT